LLYPNHARSRLAKTNNFTLNQTKSNLHIITISLAK
jgi:hypothetical protein